MAKRIEVEIIGNTANLSRAFKQAENSSSGFGRALGNLGKTAAIAIGAAGIGGLYAVLRAGIPEFIQSQKVAAQTEAVLKSTGGAAGVTAVQVDKLAQALMNKTGVDDEAIKSGENMLLTFTKIRNETGAGNDVFSQAAKVILDMDTAMSHGNVTAENLSKTSILVGKALQDPIKGATALRRVGVDLDEGQKKLIATMIKSGDTMGAQKVILAELNKEFGGSAEAIGKTLPGQINILKENFNNLAGTLVGALAPALSGVVQGLNGFVTKFSEADGAREKFKVVVDGIKALADNIGGSIISAVSKIDWNAVWGDTQRITGSLLAKLQTAVANVNWGAVGSAVGSGLVSSINAGIAKLNTANWNAVGKAMVDGVGQGIKALGQFLAGVNWPQVFVSVFNGFKAVATALATLTLSIYKEVGSAILKGIAAGIPALGSWMDSHVKAPIMSAASNLAGTIGSTTVKIGTAIINGISSGVMSTVSKVSTWFANLGTSIVGWVGDMSGVLYGAGAAVVQGFLSGMGSLFGAVKQKAQDLRNTVRDSTLGFLGIKSPSTVFIGIGEQTLEGYLVGLTNKEPAIKGKMAEIVSNALQAARTAVEAGQAGVGDAFGKLGEYASRAFEAKTQAILDKVSARFDKAIAKWQTYADAATPAEKKLAAIDAAESQRTRDAALTQAQAQLVTAQSMDEGVAKAEAVAAALEAIRQANLANTIADLESQAEGERAAREAAAAAHIAALEATKARETQNLEERRRQMEESLAAQLSNLQTSLAKHPEQYAKIQKQIIALLNSYGVSMKNSGELLGKAFAHGLDAAADEVTRSAKNLANIVKRYLALNSPAETGPMSDLNRWWQPLGPMLASQMKTGEIAKGAAQMAASAYGKPRLGNPAYGTYAGMSPSIAGMGTATGTVVNNYYSAPNYLGTVKDVARAITQENQRVQSRNR